MHPVAPATPRPRRRRHPALAIAAVATVAAALPGAASAAPNVVSGATYIIEPAHSFWTVTASASGEMNRRVSQERRQGGGGGAGAHQKFTVTQAGTTGGRPYFRIRPTNNTGACFDVEGASPFDGARIQTWPCISGRRNQHFFFDSTSGPNNGYRTHKITVRHSEMVIDVIGGSKAEGTGLHQYPNLGLPNQRFNLYKTS